MAALLAKLFKIFRILVSTIAIYAVIMDCFYIYYLLRGRKTNKQLSSYVGNFFSRRNGILLCIMFSILGFMLSPHVFGKFENTNIGSFLEKETYREQYYVYIRDNDNLSKSYRVKADIFKGPCGYETYTDDGEETFVVKGNGYFLEKIYWNNGGYLIFENSGDFSSTQLYPGQETKVTDYHNDDYYVTLTTEKVK